MKKRVLIIGGGASGLTAAITAASAGAKVTVLEKQSSVGKKILMTGNGKCNLTNLDQNPEKYRSDDPAFVASVLDTFSMEDAIAFFHRIGIFTKDKNGYVYPYSEQAASVTDLLREEAQHRNVKLSTNADVLEIRKEDGVFYVKTEGWTYEGDAVILATGSAAGLAGSTANSADESASVKGKNTNGSVNAKPDLTGGFGIAASVGHHVETPLPALVQLYSDRSWDASLAGIRIEARVELYAGDRMRKLSEDLGEVQLTAKGISGIPVFQVSRFASRALAEKKKVLTMLDLFPGYSGEETFALLSERAAMGAHKSAEQLLVGLFPKKLIPVLLKKSGISMKIKAGDLGEKELRTLVGTIHGFEVPIRAAGDLSLAQVVTGGVSLSEVDPQTMESKLIPGLFFAGEILNMDGACGGYNLQWAWSTGHIAGEAASR